MDVYNVGEEMKKQTYLINTTYIVVETYPVCCGDTSVSMIQANLVVVDGGPGEFQYIDDL